MILKASSTDVVLVVAGTAESLVNFRGELLREIVSAGMQVNVVAPDFHTSIKSFDLLSSWGVKCHSLKLSRTGLNPLSDIKSCLALFRLVAAIRPSFVLCYTVKPVIYGMLASWLVGRNRRYALITGLGYAFTQEAKGRRRLVQLLVKMLYRLSLGKADLVFFQNPDDEALFRSLNILSAESKSVILNGSGVNLDFFCFKSIGERAAPTSFLMTARLLSDKGVREYVAAARIVRQTYPRIRFDLLGGLDNNPTAICEAELNSWVADGVISYLGRVSDVRPSIASCSVFVLPSYREGTPRSVLEAMAMGRPIITTDAPGCRETVIDGENGFLVPVKSVDALVEAMTRFIEDPDLAARMGKRSREIAEDKYDVHKVNAVMLKEMGIQ
ncbi:MULTISPECIES: glycosyltransferase family 4 protein [Halopseudomonas]|uniref:glycosyltransferase family 4 protein n=1 Tax=Halopseudomonas TaxID=2901189 RepID=UPI0022B66F9F|nr:MULTISPECIES: glycosyltransferase family 4 protein [Halopseudomonas]